MKTISATEFKAKCLAIMDEVQRTGEPVTVLKRGKPVVDIQPSASQKDLFARYALGDWGEIIGDVIEPPLPAEDWDANRGEF